MKKNMKRGANYVGGSRSQGKTELTLDTHRRRPPAMPPPADSAENHDEDFPDEDGGTPFVPVEIRSSDDGAKAGRVASSRPEHATDDPAYEMIIPFLDTAIVAFRKTGRLWVAIDSICEELGIEYSSQCSRLEVVREFEWREFATSDTHNRELIMFCVAAEQFNAWISGINIKYMDTDKALKFLKYRLGAINFFCDFNRYPKPTGQPVSLESQLRRLEAIAAKTYEETSVVNQFFMQFAEFEIMRQERIKEHVKTSSQIGGDKTPVTTVDNK